jgi:UDP-N-acetylglucosamine transferase subunit ALG13
VLDIYRLNNNIEMMLFVTVGTTEFDELLDEIDCDAFYNLLKELGYSKVIYQFGRGKHIPQSRKDITIVTLDFTPSISDFFAAADTIISHCGAGTLLECLKINKRVVAVVNDTLAGNHQDELFSKLLKEGYIVGYKTHRDVMKDLGKLKENLQAKVRKY